MRRKSLAFPIALVLALFCLEGSLTPSLGQENNKESRPMVPILGTQLLTIHSTIVGRDFELQVNLPRHFSDTIRRFPVLFLLDSQWDFPLANAIFGEQYYDGFVPEIVIVGIAAGGPNPNYDSLRAIDLTPTRVGQSPQSGGAPKFLEFIKKEVIPLVESKYRVKPDDRALMGSSLGGLFTLYAMFEETGLFNRYVLTSPALSWDNGILFTYEKDYAAKNTRLPVHLFMARGELEPGGAEFQKFVDLLRSRNYAGLDLQDMTVPEMGHSGGKSVGYPRGLQAVYARPTVTLTPAQLDAFVGTYQIAPQVSIDITRENQQLVLVAPDHSTIPLHASSNDNFFAKGIFLVLQFERDGTGNVTGAQVRQYAGNAHMQKVR